MAEEASNIHEVRTTSDGTVKISVEKYNDLIEKSAAKPPVINRTTVIKTDEMLAKEQRAWGGTLMGLGTSASIVGAFLYKAGRSKAS